jgi:uncharacterized DUF497 family protein
VLKQIVFEWDERKNKTNILKHKISFEEACSVFNDPNILSILDEEHSQSEERWISLGMNYHLKIITVIHLFKENSIIRLISARRATKNEQAFYIARKIQ